MKVEITPQHMKGPGINIQGPHVTMMVWELFNYSMMANRIDCPWYKARQKASAFFQGGSDRPSGEWVFIEFWSPTQTDDYLNLINAALAFLDENGRAVDVMFDSEDESLVKLFKAFANFYEYPLTATGKTGYTFTPKDSNAITTMVEWGIKYPGIFTVKDKGNADSI